MLGPAAPIRRRYRDRDGNVIPPMTLGNMRQNGATRVMAYCCCGGCNWSKSFGVSDWPDDYPVPDIGLRLTCPACGCTAIETRPDWSDKPTPGATKPQRG